MIIYTTMTDRRDADFMRIFRRTLEEHADECPTVRQLARLAVQKPAPQFYVSYGYARRVLRERRKNLRSRCKGRCAEQLWLTLENAVRKLEKRHGIAADEALQRVLADSAAPSFFISPATAIRIYWKSIAPSRRHSALKKQVANKNRSAQ